MNVTGRCSRAGAQALRLAADPAETRSVRHPSCCGAARRWRSGWPAGHPPSSRCTSWPGTPSRRRTSARQPLHLRFGRPARRSSAARRAASRHTARTIAEQVHHPVEDTGARRHSVAGFWHATQHSRRYAATTTNISYGPGGRDNLLDIWRLPEVTPGHRAPVLMQVPGGALGDQRETRSGRPVDEPDGRTGLDLRADQLQPESRAARGRRTSSTSSGRSPGSARTSPTTAATPTSSRSPAARRAPTSARWPR